MWVGSEGCEAAVRNSWNEEERDGDMENLFEHIQLCARNLEEWSKRDFGEITNLLQEKKKKLHKLGEEPRTEAIIQQEAELRREAIRFAIETSFNCVIIESDSLGVVKAIQDSADSTCHIGHIIEDMKQLAKALKSYDFHHTKRKANQVAHTLARNAIHVDTVLTWLEEIPPYVSSVIHLDAV
nr:hypothetical protein CFP56_50558 [Quercus suber]